MEYKESLDSIKNNVFIANETLQMIFLNTKVNHFYRNIKLSSKRHTVFSKMEKMNLAETQKPLGLLNVSSLARGSGGLLVPGGTFWRAALC